MSSSTPARRTKKAAAKPKSTSMFEVVSDIDDDGNYEALIFGEKFTLSTDVNGWLLLMAAGDTSKFVDLVESLIVIPEPEDGERIEVVRMREKRRFSDLLVSQKDFSVEQAAELIASMTEAAAGNEDEE